MDDMDHAEMPEVQPMPAAEMSTQERLRAFEDKYFGGHRHDGKIEKGRGSLYAHPDLSAHRDHHAALEALIAAEAEHSAATAAMAAADRKLEAAVKRAQDTEV